jgi:hypothetical protein
MVITKSHLKLEIDSMDEQYLDVLYQLIKKTTYPTKAKNDFTSLISKLFFLIFPKEMDWKLNGNAILDSLIAATAYTHHLTLLTRNESDFVACDIALINPWVVEF